ncbi:GUA1 [Symbiodinium sp. KB8]|nr:GUA1 [Symbiodinium sp. KB8]
MAEFAATHDEILVLDFGSQLSHLICRRLREYNVYCELHSCVAKRDLITSKPNLKGVIFSGGPFSVYEEGAPHVTPEVWEEIQNRKLPVLGICYGLQELCTILGGKVDQAPKREFGFAELHLKGTGAGEAAPSTAVADKEGGEGGEERKVDPLFLGVDEKTQVWMSHGDKIIDLPAGFETIGTTSNTSYAAVVNNALRCWGLQYHPEVTHTAQGRLMLRNFALTICGVNNNWTMSKFLEEEIARIRAQVGPDGHVIGAVSGGVDSTVAAVLLNRAIGDRFHAVLVDNGVMRKNEAEEVLKRLRDECKVNLTVIDASERFLSQLEGVEDPEKKRKIIGNTFIHVFEDHAEKLAAKLGKVDFLLQGTLYPDVIESISFKGPSATIKTHHNVGGLLEQMKLKLIEPLRELFKDEVRRLGIELGLPHSSVFRHPFPGPGLAIRILGPISKEGLRMVREADEIYLEELRESGHYDNIGQAFAVLLPCKSVGVMGDGRTYEQVIALRAVATTDYMTADWYRMPYDLLAKISTRIINEVRGVNRVVYDVSSKPPSTIEWE